MKIGAPNIVVSGLSRTYSNEGVTVDVQIYRFEDSPNWAFDVVNEGGTSSVWDLLFETDAEAYQAFEDVIEEKGITFFLDDEAETLH
jgi:hypothetical protein